MFASMDAMSSVRYQSNSVVQMEPTAAPFTNQRPPNLSMLNANSKRNLFGASNRNLMGESNRNLFGQSNRNLLEMGKSNRNILEMGTSNRNLFGESKRNLFDKKSNRDLYDVQQQKSVHFEDTTRQVTL
jgi:hypothetical protein